MTVTLGVAALVLVAACSTRLDPATAPAEGRPCASDRDCPQPTDPCQVWTCWQEVCTGVAAAKDTLLPRESQVKGDCKELICDGLGKAVGIADKTDSPPEDDNPCADEVCQDGEPAFPPVEVGTPCGRSGFCNGHGRCGGCVPEDQRCTGNKPETCSEEGAWESEGPCAAETPLCIGKACIGIPEVAAGDGFSCARIGDGKVRCFGDPGGGRLGEQGARRIAGLSGVVQIAAGAQHTCALLSNQTVKCWGSNAVEQLGDKTGGQRGAPGPVPKLEKVTQITAGEEFSCAVVSGGTAVCWGANGYGQLGVGGSPAKPALVAMSAMRKQGGAQDRPAEVVSLSGAVALSLGWEHACARLADGGVSCWGNDSSGELGRGSLPVVPAGGKKPPPAKPSKALVAVKGLKDVVEVAAGAEHACARLGDGSVMCWGRNHHGQLGDGTTKAQVTPVKVKGLAGAVGLAIGIAHSCARLQDGTVSCWGRGAEGQVGDEAKVDHLEPFAVPGLTGVAALSAGGEHNCARLENRTFVCWGANGHGELGSGSSGEKPAAIVW